MKNLRLLKTAQILGIPKADNEKESKFSQDFLNSVQERIEATQKDNTPAEKSLEVLKNELSAVQKSLTDANAALEELKIRQTTDDKLKFIVAKLEALEKLPDPSTQITKLQISKS